jgi:hypothetical protein
MRDIVQQPFHEDEFLFRFLEIYGLQKPPSQNCESRRGGRLTENDLPVHNARTTASTAS